MPINKPASKIDVILGGILSAITGGGAVLAALVPLNEFVRPWLITGEVFGMLAGLLSASVPTVNAALDSLAWRKQLLTVLIIGILGSSLDAVMNLIVLKNLVFHGFEIALAICAFVTMASLGFMYANLVRLLR